MRELVGPIEGSPLVLHDIALAADAGIFVGDEDADSLLYVSAGTGALALDGRTHPLAAGSAALVLAREDARLTTETELAAILVTVGPAADRHAPLGARAVVSAPEALEQATSARSFRLLLGPHNGSLRATMFAGFVPPGSAPWHYHLYDEIVWLPRGPGRVHIGEAVTEHGAGSAFRLRPRQVHIVENAGETEMEVLGVFTPAGSPSAAYLEPHVAAEYRFAG
jgi:quercetin dioxygenase-like cupin family protein